MKKGKTERVQVLWVDTYSDKLDYKRKKILGEILRRTNPKLSQSIGMFIRDFLTMTPDRHINTMIIYHQIESKFKFVIESNYIKLIKNHKLLIFKCGIEAGNEIYIQSYEDNALWVIKDLFKELLKIKKKILTNMYK